MKSAAITILKRQVEISKASERPTYKMLVVSPRRPHVCKPLADIEAIVAAEFNLV